jgi:ketosteroid isomerase-like protein
VSAPSSEDRTWRDRTEIRALVDGYAAAIDRGDVDGFVALWADDAQLEVFEDGPSRPATGRLRARSGLRLVLDAVARFRLTLHHVTTHLAEVDGDAATGTTCCEAHHVTGADAAAAEDLVMHIRYRDRFTRAGGAWLFQHRCVDVLFTEVRILEELHRRHPADR